MQNGNVTLDAIYQEQKLLEDRIEQLGRLCQLMMTKVNRIESNPLREAVRKCETPEQVKELIRLWLMVSEDETTESDQLSEMDLDIERGR